MSHNCLPLAAGSKPDLFFFCQHFSSSFFVTSSSRFPPFPLLYHRKKNRLLSLFIYWEEKLKARTFFSSVRFAKITSIMILLAKEKMWLLKMDLWKMAFLKNAIWTILSSWQKFSPSFIHFKRSVFVCKSESHNARGILKFPVCKLLRLIWFLWGITSSRTCRFPEN